MIASSAIRILIRGSRKESCGDISKISVIPKTKRDKMHTRLFGTEVLAQSLSAQTQPGQTYFSFERITDRQQRFIIFRTKIIYIIRTMPFHFAE